MSWLTHFLAAVCRPKAHSAARRECSAAARCAPCPGNPAQAGGRRPPPAHRLSRPPRPRPLISQPLPLPRLTLSPLSFSFLLPPFVCSLNMDPWATRGDATIQRIIDALPKNCPEAGRDCKK